jgi:hypothetical protein
MKILGALRLRLLTSEPYCPCAADEDGVFGGVARIGAAVLGAGDNLLERKKKGRTP